MLKLRFGNTRLSSAGHPAIRLCSFIPAQRLCVVLSSRHYVYAVAMRTPSAGSYQQGEFTTRLLPSSFYHHIAVTSLRPS